MAEDKKARKPHLTLRQPDFPIAAELLALLETITAAGAITDAGLSELQAWLDVNANSTLPAVDFLRLMLRNIFDDGNATQEERKALYQAIERVMPPESRDRARSRRLASELLGKSKLREEKTARHEHEVSERQRNRPLLSANFMVAGVKYEGRPHIIEHQLKEGQQVFFVGDPSNQYDANAIEIRLQNGSSIGYVPREYAATITPLLDTGSLQAASCVKILAGRQAPIPIIQAYIYRPDATVTGAIQTTYAQSATATGPIKLTYLQPKQSTSGSGCLVSVIVIVLVLLVPFLP